MVAMIPLSLYTNPVRGSPLSVRSMFWAACLASWMAGWATWGCSPPLPSPAPARSPTTNTSGRPGTLRSSPTTIRPPRVCSRPRTSASGWARTPAPQISVRVGITVPSLRMTSFGVARSSACPRRTSTPRLDRISRACPRELGWNGASRWSMASSRTTLAWWMSRSGKSWTSTCLNSSWRAPAISTPVGPQPQRVGHALEREAVLLDPRDPEGGRGRPGGQDQEIVGEPPALLGQHLPGLEVHRRDRGHPHRGAPVAAHDGPHRVGDVGRLDQAGGQLVQQGLEQVVVVLLQQRDPHRRFC